MAKFTDAVRATLQGHFDAGDQPTEAQFDALILAIQEGIEEHDHDGTGDGDGIADLGPLDSLEMSDDAWIGIGAALERIVFGADGDYVGVKDANFGVGNIAPKSKMEIATITGGVGRVDVLRIAEGNDALGDIAGVAFSTRGDVADRYVKSAIFHKQAANGDWGLGSLVFAVDSNADGADVAHTDEKMRLTPTGRLGLNEDAPAGKAHIDQSVDNAAIPTLVLDQADISEGFIDFIGSNRGIIPGATSSTESVRVELGGVVYRLALYVDG